MAADTHGDFVINSNDGPRNVELRLNNDGDLTIEGEIITNNCPVGCGPDFVFEPDYELMPLDELEVYINAHKHLPIVQSAEQMSEEGIKPTEFSMLLLEKLEELTLYAIQQQRTNEERRA